MTRADTNYTGEMTARSGFDTARYDTFSSAIKSKKKKKIVKCNFPDCKEHAIYICSASLLGSEMGCGHAICE